jgi:DNA-binding transcriptional LysR family regulator
VSRHVSSLEQDLGATLFRRSTRQLHLTDAGSAFYERTIKILGDIGEAWRLASATSTDAVGSLKVWAPEEFGTLYLSHLIPQFMAQHPGLSIEITLGAQESGLPSQEYDLALLIGEPGDSRFYAHRFARNQYVICCAPAYLEKVEEPTFPSALSAQNCLIQNGNNIWQFSSVKSSVNISAEVSGNFRSNLWLPILEATLAGAGFARLPLWIAGKHLADGCLVTVLNKYQVQCQDSSIYGLYPEKRTASPKIRALIEFLSEGLDENDHWN